MQRWIVVTLVMLAFGVSVAGAVTVAQDPTPTTTLGPDYFVTVDARNTATAAAALVTQGSERAATAAAQLTATHAAVASPAASPVASPVASSVATGDVGKSVTFANFNVILKSAEFAQSVLPGSSLQENARGKFLIVWLEITRPVC